MEFDMAGDEPSDLKAKKRHLGAVAVRAEEIVRLREEKNWSQATLAKRAGCSLTTVKRIEAGEESFPSTLERIAKPLGTTLNELTKKSDRQAALTIRKVIEREKVILTYVNIFLINCDETSELPELIAKTLEKAGVSLEATVDGIDDGSIVVGLRINSDDMLGLLKTFIKLQLDIFDLVSVQFVPSPDLKRGLDDIFRRRWPWSSDSAAVKNLRKILTDDITGDLYSDIFFQKIMIDVGQTKYMQKLFTYEPMGDRSVILKRRF